MASTALPPAPYTFRHVAVCTMSGCNAALPFQCHHSLLTQARKGSCMTRSRRNQGSLITAFRCVHSSVASAATPPGASQLQQPLPHPSNSSGLCPPGSHRRVAGRAQSRQRSVAARVATAEAVIEEYSADNFYEILGVSPMASSRDIKRAYYNLMKDFHPDLSGDEESTEFCTLLNDIYETLMDPDRRATYDALAGFSMNSINPFADTSLPADQVFVDEFTCIGCRNCTNVCPSSFAIEDDFGRARVMKQGADATPKLQEAIDTCPVNCIHWVTASQLSLLEAAMAKMERVAVWSLMSGGGGGRDVFSEASLAWEKRQAQVRAKQQREQATAAWASWWSSVGASAGANMYAQAADAAKRAAASASSSYSSYDDGDDAGGGGASSDEEYVGSKEGARIAKLAAKAARAARQWKSWQELQQRSRRSGLLLSASVSSQDWQD